MLMLMLFVFGIPVVDQVVDGQLDYVKAFKQRIAALNEPNNFLTSLGTLKDKVVDGISVESQVKAYVEQVSENAMDLAKMTLLNGEFNEFMNKVLPTESSESLTIFKNKLQSIAGVPLEFHEGFINYKTALQEALQEALQVANVDKNTFSLKELEEMASTLPEKEQLQLQTLKKAFHVQGTDLLAAVEGKKSFMTSIVKTAEPVKAKAVHFDNTVRTIPVDQTLPIGQANALPVTNEAVLPVQGAVELDRSLPVKVVDGVANSPAIGSVASGEVPVLERATVQGVPVVNGAPVLVQTAENAAGHVPVTEKVATKVKNAATAVGNTALDAANVVAEKTGSAASTVSTTAKSWKDKTVDGVKNVWNRIQPEDPLAYIDKNESRLNKIRNRVNGKLVAGIAAASVGLYTTYEIIKPKPKPAIANNPVALPKTITTSQ